MQIDAYLTERLLSLKEDSAVIVVGSLNYIRGTGIGRDSLILYISRLVL